MRIALISDIHEDLISLENAFRIIEKKKCDEVVCLGDIVGYNSSFYNYQNSKNASKCVQLVKKNCSITVLGNHDLHTIKRIPIYNSGIYYPENWYNLSFNEQKNISKGNVWDYRTDEKPVLSDYEYEYLNNLNEFEIADYNNGKVLFSHFAFPDPTGSTRENREKASELKHHFLYMDKNECKLSFSGHGHFNGMFVGSKRRIRVKNFGAHYIKDKTQWICIPCIANAAQENGFAVFDFKDNRIEIIKL